MSLVDDIKDMFSTHAAALQERMHGIEVHLNDVSKSSDYTARSLASELAWHRFTISAELPTFAEGGSVELLTVPPGVYLQLLHWTWNSGEAERPVLMINERQNVISTNNESSQVMGQIMPSELILPPNTVILAANRTKKQATTLMLAVKEFEDMPSYAVSMGEGE